MSDENRNEKEKGKGKEVQEESPKANQLSEQELKEVGGGWGDIKPTPTPTIGSGHKPSGATELFE